MVFECPWEFEESPVHWKLANIVLIFKMGKKEDPENNRPDSLTSATAKIWRRLLREVLRSTWKTTSREIHNRKVLLIKPDFLL